MEGRVSMDALDLLRTNLLDLLSQLEGHEIPLILGGGYGLLLKQQHLRTQNVPTLFDVEIWPEARSTNDLDVFLRAEVVTDAGRMRMIRQVLGNLKYEVVESANFYQFFKPVLPSGIIKIDILVGPLGQWDARANKDVRRVRPKIGGDLHARRVDEALGIEDGCTAIPVRGNLTSGESCEALVYIPHAFSYLMMKLFAFQDRKDDADKEMGRHHALDIFRILAMLTKDEYASVKTMREQYAENPLVQEAERIIREQFGGEESIGVLRLREHSLFRREMDVERFLRELRLVFSAEGSYPGGSPIDGSPS
jgi:hypothetical protein